MSNKNFNSAEKSLKNFIEAFNSLKFLFLYNLDENNHCRKCFFDILKLLEKINLLNEKIIFEKEEELSVELVEDYKLLYFKNFIDSLDFLNIKGNKEIDYDFIENIFYIDICLEDIVNNLSNVELDKDLLLTKKYINIHQKINCEELCVSYLKNNIIQEKNIFAIN